MNEIQTQRRNALRAGASRIVLQYARTRVNGRPASDASVRARHQTLMAACNQLWELGYQLQDIRNLEQRHVRALVQHWFTSGYQPKTIENNLSNLRLLSGWIGKPSLIPERHAARFFLPDVPPEQLKVGTVAARSKSWSQSGVDVGAMIERAHGIDVRFGAMIFLGVAFGLRRQEQVLIRPHQADGGTHLRIRDDIGKGGRDRDVPIQHPFQRAALDNAKTVVRKGESLGWPRGSKQANIRHYTYTLNVTFDLQNNCLVGVLAQVREHVEFVAATPAGLEARFRQAVDGKLAGKRLGPGLLEPGASGA